MPFTMTTVATFNLPWRLAFLPDDRMLITEKVGPVWLVTPQGEKIRVENTPPVYYQGQNGMHGVYLSPKLRHGQEHLSHLYRARRVRWRPCAGPRQAECNGHVGQTGKPRRCCGARCPRARAARKAQQVAFSPDGQYLFLSVGDRQRMTPAQDPDQPVGKILRLTLDGKPAPGNPNFGKTGAATIPLIDPPRDTELAKDAKVVSTYTFPDGNLTPSETWATGFRTPYGMAFSPTGELWEVEHGPRGGDELNLIEKGKNYGWPLVSYGINYNGVPIPNPDTRP